MRINNTSKPGLASGTGHAAAREAVIQALADALVASWRRDHPESALHCRAS